MEVADHNGSGGDVGAQDRNSRLLADVFWLGDDSTSVVLIQLLEDSLLIGSYGSTFAEKIAFTDIVGSSAVEYPGVRHGQVVLYVYPKVSGPRTRRCLTFSLDSRADRQENIDTCQLWSRAIEARSRGVSVSVQNGRLVIPKSRARHYLIYVNPFSGTGKADTLLKTVVLPMLEDAGCTHRLVRSTSAGFVISHMKEVDLTGVDCIMAISGDGMLFEIVNGIMERSDHDEVLNSIPLTVIPCGSGNAISGSINNQVKEYHHASNAAFVAVKGKPVDLDVMEIQGGDGRHLYSVLSIEWGLLAEIDIKSDSLRHLGPARFMLTFAQQIFKFPSFPCRFSYLPANGDGKCPCAQPSRQCTCMPPLSSSEPLSEHWVVKTGNYVIVQPTIQTHLTETVQFRRQSQLCDGRIHLVMCDQQCTRSTLCQLFVEMGRLRNRIDDHLGVHDLPALAFRIEPTRQDGKLGPYHLAVDGEPFPYTDIQGRIHPGMAKILASLA
ncbi:sphingosine kinase 1-like [Sycon ciliatum]|uniref:sphingosine kinase 1-like n=1 Tax=Sycon ciliatum TaxID=27933 RepID=UPI0020AB47B6|eukprot:scpid65891/ scgid19119/ Sphingosine kinase 1